MNRSSAGAKTSIWTRIRRRIWRWKLKSAAVRSIACPSTRRCACRKCGSGTATKLIVNLLTKRGSYRASDRSKAFPFLPLAEFARFLEPTRLSETQLLRSFRAWVRKKKKQNWKPGR